MSPPTAHIIGHGENACCPPLFVCRYIAPPVHPSIEAATDICRAAHDAAFFLRFSDRLSTIVNDDRRYARLAITPRLHAFTQTPLMPFSLPLCIRAEGELGGAHQPPPPHPAQRQVIGGTARTPNGLAEGAVQNAAGTFRCRRPYMVKWANGLCWVIARGGVVG